MKNKHIKLTSLFLILSVLSAACYGNNSGWQFKAGKKDPNSQFHFRLPAKFHDDITQDQDVNKIKLTKYEQHQALVWGLKNEEEQRYVALMRNKSGFFYGDQIINNNQKLPNGSVINTSHRMSPVEVLGANARTNEEREKYAKLDAHQQFEYLAKYLAFDAAYNKEAELYKEKLHLPVLRPFNTAQFSPYNYRPMRLKANDKLMLFIKSKNAIKPVISYLMGAISKERTVQLNVYFVGKNVNKLSVERWAQAQNIPPNMVKKHQITLNFDSGRFEKISGNKKPPVLILIRNNTSKFINTGIF